jgi:hypothetical protein
MTAAHFEVKKHAVRQTADGWVISFVVHPNDMAPDFAVAPLGTRYMLAVAEIGDDEQPISSAEMCPARAGIPTSAGPVAPEGDENRGTPFASAEPPAAEAGRLPPTSGQRGDHRGTHPAVRRAGILANDPRFQKWDDDWNAEVAAASIRRYCGVSSRRELATSPAACNRFYRLLDTYLAETGQRAEQRG